MSYDEQKARSKVVVETPTSHREYERTEAVHVPERNGISSTTVGVLVVMTIALVTIVVLLLMNKQSTDAINANLAAQQPTPIPQTTIIQQPAAQQPQAPIIVQQPAPVVQPAPIVVTQPAPAGGTSTSGTDDGTIQAAIDKKLADDPALSGLGVTVTVLDGKATIIGVVKSDSLKSQLERTVKSVRGVKSVDNQLTVM